MQMQANNKESFGIFFFFLPFESILQERGKIPKVHLQETVEELKKFNSRRKLKVIQDTRQLYEGEN